LGSSKDLSIHRNRQREATLFYTYHSRFIPEGVAEVSQILLRDTHVLPKLVSYEETFVLYYVVSTYNKHFLESLLKNLYQNPLDSLYQNPLDSYKDLSIHRDRQREVTLFYMK
jgi:hypothetical protein